VLAGAADRGVRAVYPDGYLYSPGLYRCAETLGPAVAGQLFRGLWHSPLGQLDDRRCTGRSFYCAPSAAGDYSSTRWRTVKPGAAGGCLGSTAVHDPAGDQYWYQQPGHRGIVGRGVRHWQTWLHSLFDDITKHDCYLRLPHYVRPAD